MSKLFPCDTCFLPKTSLLICILFIVLESKFVLKHSRPIAQQVDKNIMNDWAGAEVSDHFTAYSVYGMEQ